LALSALALGTVGVFLPVPALRLLAEPETPLEQQTEKESKGSLEAYLAQHRRHAPKREPHRLAVAVPAEHATPQNTRYRPPGACQRHRLANDLRAPLIC
jgi:hypothetical protein